MKDVTRVGAPKGPPLFSSEPEENKNSPSYQVDDGDPDVFLTAPDYTTDPKNRVDNPDDVRWKKNTTTSKNAGTEAPKQKPCVDQAELVRSSQRIQKRQTRTRESVNDVTTNHTILLGDVAKAASLLDPNRVQDMAVLFIKQVEKMSTAERIANLVYFGWFRKPESVIWKWGTDTWDGITESHRVTLERYVGDLVDEYRHIALLIAGGETKDGKEAERMHYGRTTPVGQQLKEALKRKQAS